MGGVEREGRGGEEGGWDVGAFELGRGWVVCLVWDGVRGDY